MFSAGFSHWVVLVLRGQRVWRQSAGELAQVEEAAWAHFFLVQVNKEWMVVLFLSRDFSKFFLWASDGHSDKINETKNGLSCM